MRSAKSKLGAALISLPLVAAPAVAALGDDDGRRGDTQLDRPALSHVPPKRIATPKTALGICEIKNRSKEARR